MQKSIHSPHFFKRILVVIYDTLLLTAIILVCNAIVIAVFTSLAGDWAFINTQDFANNKIVSLSPKGKLIGNILFCCICFGVSLLFYSWFWIKGGQTLGMRAWHLFLVRPDGKFISWDIAIKRYFLASFSWLCAGVGFLCILFHRNNHALHDIASKSYIVQHKKKPTKT